ncbi:hypothetical protein AUJ10_03025 [Candidatus Pacearchaeota archaeon CG1_02_31_27]|nr:MAG: hypothetical protein AUJ10_03025 [Candidatus Pacearchaeota archaeon CG1_02_31_27]PIN92053.1 MAG: hypothetical protein COU55_02605 [Candidatus Pacearchaeota archaeon CG10_big_fil_rev_8_21_14_0_10_31_59]PIZ81085.1 MAG: hypothetical protein COX99_00860 [Candidatus Pacearchaeota archaeon CG_4_10_14_0_2_um_filter_31_10]
MGVVRIDDGLLRQLKKLLKDEEYKYKYPSIASFINILLYEKLKNIEKENNNSGKNKKEKKEAKHE